MTAKQIFKKVEDFNDMCFEIGYEEVKIHVVIDGAYVDEVFHAEDYDEFVKFIKSEFYDWASEPILKCKDFKFNEWTRVDFKEPFDGDEITEVVKFEIFKF